MPYPVGFTHGNAANLPEVTEGNFLFTDDTEKLYLDINGSRHDLTNYGVKNISGSNSANFISIAGLDVGHYSLTGYYRYDSSSQVLHTTNVLDVVVGLDEVTSKKVVTFPSISDGDYFITKLIYNGSKVETIERIPVDGRPKWGDF